MKKTLVSAGVTALLLASGAAQAQLQIYGLIDASYGKSILSDNLGDKATFHSGGDNGSSEGNSTTRVGIKGSTDVGSGVKANFRLETAGITSDGEVGGPGVPFFNRQAWLGLSGSFGEVRLGRQDSVAFQTMVDYDFNGASNGVSALGYSGAAIWGMGRQSRSLQYISPVMGGVKVHLGYQAEDSDRSTADKASLSGAINYTAGPLSLTAVYSSKTFENGPKFGSVAGSYDLGVAKVMLGYVKSGDLNKGWNAGVVAPIGKVNVGALYAKNDGVDAVGYELFVNTEIFKSTYLYAEYGNVDKNSAASLKGTGFAVGLIYTF